METKNETITGNEVPLDEIVVTESDVSCLLTYPELEGTPPAEPQFQRPLTQKVGGSTVELEQDRPAIPEERFDMKDDLSADVTNSNNPIWSSLGGMESAQQYFTSMPAEDTLLSFHDSSILGTSPEITDPTLMCSHSLTKMEASSPTKNESFVEPKQDSVYHTAKAPVYHTAKAPGNPLETWDEITFMSDISPGRTYTKPTNLLYPEYINFDSSDNMAENDREILFNKQKSTVPGMYAHCFHSTRL